ncbi:DUF421 domain-containing protein [Alkalibacillus haloalkaliphilus]|uniref:DUF421 domain-containing protein n=1 Tax=Alkalibacillus haloalkaliphilus TaxID=94136 RepID=UPI0029366460|nr:DUF421 domain-containing protein [Alkalibacillus haloalkaliphilus]MDV2581098.1 DUF421 domain-containing protein [Alkalibacillus haloalkaliphilus]
MEELINLIVRTAGVYIAIYAVFRLMGKREIGELSIMDLIVFIMMAEVGVLSIEQTEESFFLLLTPIFVLLIIQRLTAEVSFRSNKARMLLDGTPSIIVRNGEIDEKEMKRQRYNMDDLLVQLRQQGALQLKEVELAVLETNGKLSVFQKQDNPLNYFDPIIIDGQFQGEALQQQGVTQQKVLDQLKSYGVQDITNVSVAQMHEDGSIYIDFKKLD